MTQLKFTIEDDIVRAFRSRCQAEGISMTSAVRDWMKTSRPAKVPKFDTTTRPHRRKAVREIIDLLNDIADRETEYRDNIPEKFAQRYDTADQACNMLAEAINSLEEAF
jgi:hypothetical protein